MISSLRQTIIAIYSKYIDNIPICVQWTVFDVRSSEDFKTISKFPVLSSSTLATVFIFNHIKFYCWKWTLIFLNLLNPCLALYNLLLYIYSPAKYIFCPALNGNYILVNKSVLLLSFTLRQFLNRLISLFTYSHPSG